MTPDRRDGRDSDTSLSCAPGHEPVASPGSDAGHIVAPSRQAIVDRPRGQALVEFAFVFPIFLLLFFGMIDMGRWVYTQNNLNEAAREASRSVSVETRPAECLPADARDVCAAKVVSARVFATGGPWTTTTVCSRFVGGVKTVIAMSDCTGGDYISVHVVVDPWQVLTPMIGQFLTPRIEGSSEVQVIQ